MTEAPASPEAEPSPVAAASPEPPHCVEATEVEQRIDAGRSVRLRKERWEVPGAVPLALVRKHLPGGPVLPPVLLVHGFAQNRYSWHTSLRSFSAWLAERGFDVWNVELRGHGRSRALTDEAPGAERFADYVDDVVRAAGALPGPAFWVGHSLGGAAVYGAATQAPPEVTPRGVIGIGALYQFAQANAFLKLLGTLTHFAGGASAGGRAAGRVQVRSRIAGQLLGRLYGISDIAGFAFPISGWWPGSMEPELLRERLEHGFDWTSVRVWQEMSRWAATGAFEYDAAWNQTDLPVLVVLGDEDHLMPPRDGRVAFDRSGSSDKTLQVFGDWEHETHWGHIDLILGRLAPRYTWPFLADWMELRSR